MAKKQGTNADMRKSLGSSPMAPIELKNGRSSLPTQDSITPLKKD